MHKYILLLCLLAQCAFGWTESGTFLVGTNSDFPPFSYIVNGEIIGFDIDIAKEVAHRLGKGITLKDMPFDALIPDLTMGRVDFVAAGMTANEERAKRVLFTKSYMGGNPLMIFAKGKQHLTLAELKGKTVVVVEGFTADALMTEQEGVNLIRLPIQTDAFLAIKTGRADAFVTAYTTASAFLETQQDKEYTFTPIPNTEDNCCLVLPKNRTELLAQIQKTLDEMMADGTVTKIKAKWKVE